MDSDGQPIGITRGKPMQDGRMIAVAAAIFILFLAAGCVLSYNNKPITNNPEDTYSPSDITVPKYGNPDVTDPSDPRFLICKELPGANPCTCMMCENRTSYSQTNVIDRLLSFFYDTTLRGGNCTFTPCNKDTYFQTVEAAKNVAPRTFMYGFGPSFTSSAKANLYCNYSMQIATKWMKGKGSAAPVVPSPGRALCWLDRNVLPVYMYYTNGSAIDPARSQEIALAFENAKISLTGKGAGPVLLTTEVDFNSTNATQLSLVKQQLLSYQSCTKCLKVLAVKSNDTYALSQILEDPIYNPKVDIVGFGFRANDYKDCDVNKIIAENFQFARYVQKKYNKPTIILYTGVSEGNSSDGSCTWTPAMVDNYYQNMFALTQPLASSGVIGTSFYEFTDSSGPLPCNGVEGCLFVVMSGKDEKHPEINSWQSVCSFYGAEQSYRSPLIYSTNGYGSVCDVQQNNEIYTHVAERINSGQGLETTPVLPTQEVKHVMPCGEVCVSDTPLAATRATTYDDTGNSLSAISGVNACTDYPEIDEQADDADFSAMYMRSVISQESNFDRFAVSCSKTPCAGKTKSASEMCVELGYPSDCANVPDFWWVKSGYSGTGQPHTDCPPTGYKYVCAMGLGQCIEEPGSSTMASWGCNSKGSYDPFEPYDSSCCGIHKMKDALDNARDFVTSNENALLACAPAGYSKDEYGWLTYNLASLEYYIGGSAYKGYFTQFINDRDALGSCTGETDFTVYLQQFPCSQDPTCRKFYSRQIMSRYIDAVDNKCDSECPGKK
ncbi:Uncharacterised protein [uncultured archaeon]|nr:Uncharacterised protein [uncultured archaeon]